MGLTTLHRKKYVMKNKIEPQTWMDSLDKQSKRWNMDMRFGLWNVRGLYRMGCLMTVSSELARYVSFSVNASALVVRVLGYGSGGPGSIPGTTSKKKSSDGTGSTQPHECN
jgi:hypothetical protein